jgi:CRISPR-associated protein Csd1
MIVQSLTRYYDILASDDTIKISGQGYSPAKVSFALVISPEGVLTNILDLRTDGKKKLPKVMEVPLQKSRSGKHPPPYFLCDKGEYVFGVESLNVKDFPKKQGSYPHDLEILERDEKNVVVVSPRSLECFNQFRKYHHTLLDGLSNPEIQGFLHFLDAWNPKLALQHLKFAEYKDEMLTGAFFVFEINGEYLHRNAIARNAWEAYCQHDNGDSSEECSQCLVSGKMLPIARTHQKIKGVLNAQSAGATLIGFNDPAFESYGKKQSYNAPVSESAMFKYTTVLNYLLERESKNKIQIGDTTTVFWAETKNKAYEDLILSLFNPVELQTTQEGEPQEERLEQDHNIRQLVNDILLKVKIGGYLEDRDLGIPKTTRFYILGLSPNNARLAVRYWHEDNFGDFITRVARHHIDMEIDSGDQGPTVVSVKRLLKETVPRDAGIPPLIEGLLMRSIIENLPYPIPMYNAILNRVKVERSINYARAGFIKACLIRMARTRKRHEEDVITVSLNEESTNVPYRLGRLFAVLEKSQSETNRELKSTITSKYFSSAATTPAVVFPVLLKLAQHHIAKSDWGFKSNQRIEEVLAGIDEFPAYMNLEDQGMFMLGYYHQRKAFYKKKDVNDEKQEENQ